MAVLEAYEPIQRRRQDRVSALDVAVDEIPRMSPSYPERAVAAGGGGRRSDRTRPADTGGRGRQRHATRARIVLFRKPIERRAKDTIDLSGAAA